MEPSHVLFRTAKGDDEIRTKGYNLSQRRRRILIEIDENETVGDTLARLANLGEDVATELAALLAGGFVALQESPCEMAGYGFDDWRTITDEYRTPQGAAPAGMPVRQHPTFNLDKAKTMAEDVILDALGAVAMPRIQRIHEAKNVRELRAELDDLRAHLPKLLSKRQGERVWAQLAPLMLSVR